MDPRHIEPVGDEFEPASAQDIAAIERTAGVRLPPDYSEFLAKFGRCMFAGSAHVLLESGEAAPIFTIFGGGSAPGSVLDELNLHPDLRTEHAIPIADDLFNNRFVLDCGRGGQVVLIDYSGAAPVVSRVSGSFAEFFAQIEVVPDNDAD